MLWLPITNAQDGQGAVEFDPLSPSVWIPERLAAQIPSNMSKSLSRSQSTAPIAVLQPNFYSPSANPQIQPEQVPVLGINNYNGPTIPPTVNPIDILKPGNAPSPLTIGQDSDPVAMSFDRAFNIAPQNSLGSDPPERRIAWLEYFGGLMVESEYLQRARQVIKELYRWQLLLPNLQYKIGLAMQQLQRRIDFRAACLLKQCRSSDCRQKNYPSTVNALGTVMTEAPNNWPTISLTIKDRNSLLRIYTIIELGNLSEAFYRFQTFLRGRKSLFRNEMVGRLDFVLKMVRFDLENPDTCLPLWQDTCELNWKRKNDILDAFDALKRRASDPGQGWPPLESIPKALLMEIRTRLSVALKLSEAWTLLGYLSRPDQYVGQACLVLGHVPPPGFIPSTEHLGDVQSTRLATQSIYQSCLSDPYIPRAESALCWMGLMQIAGLRQSCPQSGFVRMGLFPLHFDDYLFIKCRGQYEGSISRRLPVRKPPVTSTPAPKTVKTPLRSKKPLQSEKPWQSESPRFDLTRQVAKAYRVERILDQLQDKVEHLRPTVAKDMINTVKRWRRGLRKYLVQFETDELD